MNILIYYMVYHVLVTDIKVYTPRYLWNIATVVVKHQSIIKLYHTYISCFNGKWFFFLLYVKHFFSNRKRMSLSVCMYYSENCHVHIKLYIINSNIENAQNDICKCLLNESLHYVHTIMLNTELFTHWRTHSFDLVFNVCLKNEC